MSPEGVLLTDCSRRHAILATCNDYDLGVLNGTHATIEQIDERHGPEIERDPTERLAARREAPSAKAMAIDLDDGLALGL